MAHDDQPASPKVENIVSVSQNTTVDTIPEASQSTVKVHESSEPEPRTAPSPTVDHAGVATIDHNPEVDHPEAKPDSELDIIQAKLSSINNMLSNSAPNSNAELENGDEKAQPALFRAARFGLVNDATKLLKLQKPDLETNIVDSWTALHISAQNGFHQVVDLLLKAGANKEAKTDSCQTALHIAARNGHDPVIELLLKAGANIEAKTETHETALSIAIDNSRSSVVDLLLRWNPNLESRVYEEGWTALHCAAREGKESLVQQLLDHNADITAITSDGNWTALFLAAGWGHQKVVALLLERGAGVMSKDSEGETPIFNAADAGEVEVLKLLLQNAVPSDILSKTKKGETALYRAAKNGNDIVLSMLLDKLSDADQWIHTIVRKIEDGGETALSQAVKGRHQKVEQLLWKVMGKVDFRADAKAADEALIWAARFEKPGQERILRQLLEKRPPPVQLTLVNKAEEYRMLDPEKYINMKPATWTALHWAVYHGQAIVVWWLLARGGHLRAKDMRTAKTIAKEMVKKMSEWKPDREGAKTENIWTKAYEDILSEVDKNIILPRVQQMKFDYGKNNSITNVAGSLKSGESSVAGAGERAAANVEFNYAAYPLISALLHDPPSVQGESAHRDLDEIPTLQTPSGEKRGVCENFTATIVDFYNKDSRIDFLYRSCSVFDIIYGSGPEKVMSGTRNSDIRRLEVLEKLVSENIAPGTRIEKTGESMILDDVERSLQEQRRQLEELRRGLEESRRQREILNEILEKIGRISWGPAPQLVSRSAPRAKQKASTVGRDGHSTSDRQAVNGEEPTTSGKSKPLLTNRSEDIILAGSSAHMGEFQFRWLHMPANNVSHGQLYIIEKDTNKGNQMDWIEVGALNVALQYREVDAVV
jgi:ankyrin repeat protein